MLYCLSTKRDTILLTQTKAHLIWQVLKISLQHQCFRNCQGPLLAHEYLNGTVKQQKKVVWPGKSHLLSHHVDDCVCVCPLPGARKSTTRKHYGYTLDSVLGNFGSWHTWGCYFVDCNTYLNIVADQQCRPLYNNSIPMAVLFSKIMFPATMQNCPEII